MTLNSWCCLPGDQRGQGWAAVRVSFIVLLAAEKQREFSLLSLLPSSSSVLVYVLSTPHNPLHRKTLTPNKSLTLPCYHWEQVTIQSAPPGAQYCHPSACPSVLRLHPGLSACVSVCSPKSMSLCVY